MPDLVVNNTSICFESPSRDFKDMLDARTSFRVPGYQFSEAFRNGFWDGRKHLIKRMRSKPGWWYEAPVGLVDDLMKVARSQKVEFTVHDLRRPAQLGSITYGWNPEYVLRPYQLEAVEAAVADRGLATGKCLIDIATRGGKTLVAAAIIRRLGVRTMFLVMSEMLMRQTVALFKKVLGFDPGIIGKGTWVERDLTVVSIQTLTRNLKHERFEALLSSYDLIFTDEAHHLAGEAWRETLFELDAFYKIGLSATIFLSKKDASPKGTIWLRGATGPVVFKVSPSELIEQGYLVAPEIVMNTVEGPMVPEEVFMWPDIYNAGIVNHEARNRRICERARLRHDQGMQVVVTVKELEHVELLRRGLDAQGLRVGVIIGMTPSKDRERLVKMFESRRLDVLVGTVFGEAVDIPIIESVIVADGGKSSIAATQRFRNLTPSPGKERAVLDDFADLHHEKLAAHSQERLAVYVSHGAFRVTVDPDPVRG